MRRDEKIIALLVFQQADVIESDLIVAKIVFRDPIPRGEYNLVISIRRGDDCGLRIRESDH